MRKFIILLLFVVLGCGGSDSTVASSYPVAVIGDSLSRDVAPHIPAANLSTGGATTVDMIGRVQTESLDYKIILVMAGINDIVVCGWEVDSIISHYSDLIDIIKARTSAIVIVQSTLPTTNEDYNEDVQELNSKLQALCARKNVKYVDLWVVLYDTRLNSLKHTTDGIHLTEEGYAAWSDYIKTCGNF